MIRQPPFWILMGALFYHAALCLLNTHMFPISQAAVAVAEGLLYVACLIVLLMRPRMEYLLVCGFVLVNLVFLSMLRGSPEIRGLRDVLIPLLFFGLGRAQGDIRLADKMLAVIVCVVCAVGLLEIFSLETYSTLFNVFSYYANRGELRVESNWAKDSVLSLNGLRPDGIGRTLFPTLFGAHRASSVFLEPVSLGNFAVIAAAWGYSKGRDELMKMAFFVGAAALLIVLSDSRFGIGAFLLLTLARLFLNRRLNPAFAFMPAAALVGLLLLSSFVQREHADNLIGRIMLGGSGLLSLSPTMLLGVDTTQRTFADQGYPYMLIRLSPFVVVFLWATFWLARMRDRRGESFRGYLAIYAALILCVSGSSFFALKTAGILWFLAGSCAMPLENRVSAEKAG